MDVLIDSVRLFDFFGQSYKAVCRLERISRNDMRSSIIARIRRGHEVRIAFSSPLKHKALRKLGLSENEVPDIAIDEMASGKKFRFFVVHMDDSGYIRFHQVHVHSVVRIKSRKM